MQANAWRAALDARLAANHKRAQQLARTRTNDERRVADLAGLLEHWLIHGRPRENRQSESSHPANPDET